ncbi:hypothetical protein, partial [Klebsiella oxytoca]|uniref:hypothetical protein n=1 Tax=Klebsiella oxytoca TaxID=571 RepID=UPI001953ABF4
MTRDPENPLAFALAAWAHGQRVVYYFGSVPTADRALSAKYARKALALRADPTVLAIVGNALSLLNDDAAEQVIAKALAMDGGSPWAWGR